MVLFLKRRECFHGSEDGQVYGCSLILIVAFLHRADVLGGAGVHLWGMESGFIR